MKKAFIYLLAAVIFFASAEVMLRMMGWKPHQSGEYTYRSIPGDSLIPDTLLASRLGEGLFTAIVKDKLSYRAGHVCTGFNITRMIYDSLPVGLPRIDFHGCSFTYGMGVSDTLVYPYLYAMSHRHWSVRNYGCPGYSTLEALIILRRQKEQNDLPHAVIINYLDFHDERNSGTAEWRERLKEGFSLGAARFLSAVQIGRLADSRFPFAEVSNGKVIVQHYDLHSLYYTLWLRDYSAVFYGSERCLNRWLYERHDPQLVTEMIFREIKEFCAANKVELIVSIMSQSKATNEMKSFLNKEGIRSVDISLDFSNPIYTNLPYDGHPSPLAHYLFAEKLEGVEPK